MKYYSTNKKAPLATLHEAVVKGLAGDRGLYMPELIKPLPKEFYENIDKMTFREIACTVADAFFGEDVEAGELRRIVCDTLQFDCPVVRVTDNIYSLELFHGPKMWVHVSWPACCNTSYAATAAERCMCSLPPAETPDRLWQTGSSE